MHSQVSKDVRYRQNMKTKDPDKYAEMLRKAKERSKRNRDKRQQRWESEPQTRALLAEKAEFKQKEKERWQRWFGKTKNGVTTRRTANSKRAASTMAASASKRPREMTPAELKDHKRLLRQRSRQNETPMKSVWRLRKDRDYHRKKRAEQQPSATSHADQPLTASPIKKSEYKLVCKVRKAMAVKKPLKFARLIRNLVHKTRSPRKRQAMKEQGLLNTSSQKIGFVQKCRRRLFGKKRKTRKDALRDRHRNNIKLFYLRDDISRVLPHKRYATKHGPGYLMQQTLKAAYEMFKKEHPDIKVGYTLFTQLRPRNVRKISSTFLDTCQCVSCINVRLKVLALDRAVRQTDLDASMKLKDEYGVYHLLLCNKGPDKFHKSDCVCGKCSICKDYALTIRNHYCRLAEENPTVTWVHWEQSPEGRHGREPFVKKDSVRTLIEECHGLSERWWFKWL